MVSVGIALRGFKNLVEGYSTASMLWARTLLPAAGLSRQDVNTYYGENKATGNGSRLKNCIPIIWEVGSSRP